MIPTHCRHRTYPTPPGLDMPKTCLAGVNYDDVALPTGPRWDRLPCSAGGQRMGAKCAHYAMWTADEIAEQERADDALFANITMARTVIVAVTDNKRGVSGETKCPVCDGGTLRYSVARNGHIHAACSTSTCVRWME